MHACSGAAALHTRRGAIGGNGREATPAGPHCAALLLCSSVVCCTASQSERGRPHTQLQPTAYYWHSAVLLVVQVALLLWMDGWVGGKDSWLAPQGQGTPKPQRLSLHCAGLNTKEKGEKKRRLAKSDTTPAAVTAHQSEVAPRMEDGNEQSLTA